VIAAAFGLLSAALYGAADFLGGLAAKRSSIFAVVVISQGVGLVLLAAALPFFGPVFTARAAGFGFAAGCCGGVGVALLYRALAVGKMGVVSPITAVLAAAMPVAIGVLARGEHLSIRQSGGIAIALAAIVLVSLTPGPAGRLEFSGAGVREAVAAGLALGGFLILLALAGARAGIVALLCARLGSTLLLFAYARAVGGVLKPQRAALPVILCAGAVDVCANALYLLAARYGYLAIAAVLTSLYPASTVVLARYVLNERLARIQKVGLGAALAAAALIAS